MAELFNKFTLTTFSSGKWLILTSIPNVDMTVHVSSFVSCLGMLNKILSVKFDYLLGVASSTDKIVMKTSS